MGTWGVDGFGNDDAADWAWTLDDSSDLAIVEATLVAADVDAGEYLEAPAAATAVAAAEAVARLRGAGGQQSPYSESVDKWVVRVGRPPAPQVVTLAVRVLDRVAGPNSELRELWEESDEYEAWSAALRELRGRLTA